MIVISTSNPPADLTDLITCWQSSQSPASNSKIKCVIYKHDKIKRTSNRNRTRNINHISNIKRICKISCILSKINSTQGRAQGEGQRDSPPPPGAADFQKILGISVGDPPEPPYFS